MPPHRTQKQKVKVKVVITAAEDDPIVSKRESLVEATIYSRKEALRKISRRNHYLRIPPCAHTRKHRERQAAAPSPVMEMIEDILGEVLIWPHINAIRWVDNVVWIFRMIKAELVARVSLCLCTHLQCLAGGGVAD
jgi:hypothetical protein